MTSGTISISGTPLTLGSSGLTKLVSWTGGDTPRSDITYRKRTYRRVPITVPVLIKKGKRAGQSRLETTYARVIDDPGEGWVDRRKAKLRPDHSFSKTARIWLSTIVTPPNYFNSAPKGSDWIWGTLGGDPPLPAYLDSNDHNALISKLYEKVKGSDFDLNTFLLESHQTLALIGDTAIRVAKFYFHARKGDVSGAIRSLTEGTSRAPLRKRLSSVKGISSFPNLGRDTAQLGKLVLEAQYGWRPLFNDVYSAAEMLAQELSVPRSRVYRVSRRKVGPSVRSVDRNFWNSNETYFGPGGCKFPSETIHLKVIKAVIMETDLPDLYTRLGLANPEVGLYEVIPWSFLADWLIPIGPALQARAAASALKGTFTITEFQKYREKSAYGFYGTLADNLGSCPGDFERFAMTRTVTNSLSAMLPTVRPLSKALSFEHCINALALAVSSPHTNLKDLGMGIATLQSKPRL